VDLLRTCLHCIGVLVSFLQCVRGGVTTAGMGVCVCVHLKWGGGV